MAIAMLSALLIHVVWLARAYTHATAQNTRRVRAIAAGASLVITTILFCLLQDTITELYKNKLHMDPAAKQVIQLIASPANSICYAEISSLGYVGN